MMNRFRSSREIIDKEFRRIGLIVFGLAIAAVIAFVGFAYGLYLLLDLLWQVV